MDAGAWGIQDGYHDVHGHWRSASDDAIRAVLDAMGASGDAPSPSPVRFVRAGTTISLARPAMVVLEDGTEVPAVGSLPTDLPLGYHRLIDDGDARDLIVTPHHCHLDDDLRTWGWAVQLYALRSHASWGMGDLADLRALAEWSRSAGAGMTLVNPMGAVLPIASQQPSPYYPSSRRFRNPLYIRVEDVPGAREIGVELDPIARAGRALNAERIIDRDAVFRLKMDALARIWARVAPGPPEFAQWVTEQGAALEHFAVFCVLAERFGAGWPEWPAEYRHPSASAVPSVARAEEGRVQFHQWLQWILDQQLARAGREIGIVTDLPIGVDPGGFDAWEWQDVLALSMRVGAPPDEFNQKGQDWGLPPFDPWRLRSTGYQPFAQTVRAALRHAGGLRIDHVMGLWRLFWIPPDGGPSGGVYVRYPVSDLLDVVALESVRAGAYIVGEDLGTVEAGVREELHDRRILSTRLMWFEDAAPEDYPELALAAVTTHDLATIAGLWTGADVKVQEDLDLHPNRPSIAAQRDRLRGLLGLDDSASVSTVVTATYQRLARAPSRVVTATLDDALGVEERPNQPGTVDEWPNWRIALPTPFEAIAADEQVAAVAAALDETR